MESSSIDVVYGHVSHLPPSTLKQARWKSMSGLELSGYINVKIPLKERKFGSWKAWKRQWCVISRSSNSSVSLRIGSEKGNATYSIQIPENALLCRTESRNKSYAFGIFSTNKKHKEAFLYVSGESETDTQNWMSNIRCLLKPAISSEDEFEISLIDNCHSREAALAGLYGILSVTPSEIIIKDPHTNKIKVTWHWSQISHSYLPLPANAEDVHRVCTIRTSNKFKVGEGELEMFCMRADKLHEKLSVCPRFSNIPRIVTQPLPPTPDMTPPPTPPRSRVNTSPSATSLETPPMLLTSRRMSRSENDLQKFFFQRSLNSLRQNSSQELILLSHENVGNIKKTPSFIFANIGFLISTPGNSEPGSLNDVHLHDNKHAESYFQHVNKPFQDKIEYEMIDEEDTDQSEGVRENSECIQKQDTRISVTSGDYEEIIQEGEFENEYQSLEDTPPPLPPRKSNQNSSLRTIPLQKDEKGSNFRTNEYLSMMPHKNVDQKYIVMANLKDKILVSEPIPI
ncbi:hypothetical protein PGB90_000425 [Kerria lacca]